MPRVRQDIPPAPAERPPAEGLACRKCGCAHFRVVYLKRVPGGVMRVRECRHCGKRMRTRETMA